MFKSVFSLALPSIISNITVPLLGLLDVIIVGHLNNTAYIGAIAVGSMMFSLLYWGFGFLRMGTSGLTAHAFGAKNTTDVTLQLFRPLCLSLFIACCLLICQHPLEWGIFTILGDTEQEVCRWASVYFRICIWGAPAVLGLYVLNGWYIGIQKQKITMYIALYQNLINLLLSLFFVYQCNLQVQGVALGTLIAQWCGLFFALGWWYLRCKAYHMPVQLPVLLKPEALKRYFQVNRDIFGRTLCLIAVTMSFTVLGAHQGEVILAVNTLMMQLFTIFSYVMDGFAFAGESLVGCYAGAGELHKQQQAVRTIFHWGWLLTAGFTLLYGVGTPFFLSLFTNQTQILDATIPYQNWTILIPLCGFSAFLWDGIYIGLIATQYMFRIMLLAMLTYFGVYFLLAPSLGNHGLWIAFLTYLSVRGIGQWWCYRICLNH